MASNRGAEGVLVEGAGVVNRVVPIPAVQGVVRRDVGVELAVPDEILGAGGSRGGDDRRGGRGQHHTRTRTLNGDIQLPQAFGTPTIRSEATPVNKGPAPWFATASRGSGAFGTRDGLDHYQGAPARKGDSQAKGNAYRRSAQQTFPGGRLVTPCV